MAQLKNTFSWSFSAAADFDGYRKTFLEFHGFGIEGVDYDAEIDP